jgi:multidrug efflux pump subunit AcrA (membrane-fusion protein)
MSNRWQWAFGVLILAGLAGCGARGGPASAGADSPLVTVRTEPARVGTVAEVVEGLGRCEALPDRLATLTPAVEGHVEALRVMPGARVQKGQPIIELDRSVARADLAEKTATRDSLKAALALLQSLPRPEERRANELAVEQARVAVERARAISEKLRPLLARHEVSEQQVFDAEKALDAARLQQQAAEATLHAMMIGPRPEAVAEAEARIETAEGAVAFSKAHLEFHTIRAPIDGVLDSLTCHPGQTIAIGAPVGEVVDTRQLYATVWLPPRSTQAIRPGQAAEVQAAEIVRGSRQTSPSLAGRVDVIGRIADPQTGNLPVRVLVENPGARLAVGESVQVTITLNQHEDALQVPAAAIYDLGEGPVVGVVRDGKAALLQPELGASREGWVTVSNTDLKPGEPVIIEGAYALPEGTPVQIEPDRAAAHTEVTR